MAKKIFKEKSWADYDIGDPSKATIEDLRKVVQRAAKTANQRLLRLERAGFTSGVYVGAMRDLGNVKSLFKDGKPSFEGARRRFKENPGKLTINELRHEYRALRSFMSAKSSTVQGRKDTNWKRYQTARKNGFQGTEEEFYIRVEKYFTKKAEALFDSNAIYESITGGDVDIMDEIIEKYGGENAEKNKGRAIIELRKKSRARKQSKIR